MESEWKEFENAITGEGKNVMSLFTCVPPAIETVYTRAGNILLSDKFRNILYDCKAEHGSQHSFHQVDTSCGDCDMGQCAHREVKMKTEEPKEDEEDEEDEAADEKDEAADEPGFTSVSMSASMHETGSSSASSCSISNSMLTGLMKSVKDAFRCNKRKRDE